MGEFEPAWLALLALLIVLNAFFVAAEFGLVSVRRTRMQELADGGSRRARGVLTALDDINPMLSTVQVGVTMCSLGIGYVTEPAVTNVLRDPLSSLGMSGRSVEVSAFLIAMLLMTWLTVVIGELLPKTVSLQKADSVAMNTIGPLFLLKKAAAPLIWVLNGSLKIVLRVLSVEQAPGMHLIHSEEELKMLVSQSSKGGVLEDSEQEMLYNVFDFADTDVAQVMVPRPDVVAFPVNMPTADLLSAIALQPFTRYPIYRGAMDDVLGILHIRDLFTAAEQQGKDLVRVESLLRPAHVVPESKSLAGLLADFRRSKSHMALVIDEYGSLAGIATLEDLIEEIVGEIDDEHDRPERPLELISEGHIRVDGKYSVEELNERFGLGLPEDDYLTIGGVVFGLLGQAPHEGDVVRLGGLRMEVVETDGPRIVHVDLIMREAGSGQDGTSDAATDSNLGDVSGLEVDADEEHVSEGGLDLIPGADSRRPNGAGPTSA
ncbi:MAG: hemolysin family protein [Gaiellales bacterium]